MVAIAQCIGCRNSSHSWHIDSWGIPPRDTGEFICGGYHCPCDGGCTPGEKTDFCWEHMSWDDCVPRVNPVPKFDVE